MDSHRWKIDSHRWYYRLKIDGDPWDLNRGILYINRQFQGDTIKFQRGFLSLAAAVKRSSQNAESFYGFFKVIEMIQKRIKISINERSTSMVNQSAKLRN